MIAVLGLGFVGLTVALGFAEKGTEVYGVETDTFRADFIRNGKIPYFEPGLDEALERHLDKRFHVLTDIDDVPNGIDCFFICVGGPEKNGDGLDYSKMFRAISDIVDTGFEDYYTIAIKTPMAPGTMDNVVLPYFEEEGIEIGKDLGVVYNPEFIREGQCWHDFTFPARIVVGVGNDRDEQIMRKTYEGFNVPIMTVSYATAEFIRYLSSTLLATMVSYSNEMAYAARSIGGIDIAQAFKILQMDGRWADNTMKDYVYPGCGFGGISLPKDTEDFIRLANEHGADVPILENVLKVNNDVPKKICDEIVSKCTPESKIGILGLAFKEGSSDVRNSSSTKIIDRLIEMGYENICAYDPIANEEHAMVYGQKISYAFSTKELCNLCDVIVITTPWKQFKSVKDYAKGKTIIDCRYML
ncbi:MAG: nucleotide sugar dehydrogenase [Coriobacteriales bacterium]|jgi:UDPglucose 6-dehydrogenase